MFDTTTHSLLKHKVVTVSALLLLHLRMHIRIVMKKIVYSVGTIIKASIFTSSYYLW